MTANYLNTDDLTNNIYTAVDSLKVMNTYCQTINASASYFVSLLTPDITKVQTIF